MASVEQMSGVTVSGKVHNASDQCCHQLDPMSDPRWERLVETHPKASVFHSAMWLRALQRTYGYKPIAFTTSDSSQAPPSALQNGAVFCEIESWLTGRRLVSLPFSDFCEPLFDSSSEFSSLLQFLSASKERQHFKKLQLRPLAGDFSDTFRGGGWQTDEEFYHHSLDLRPTPDELLKGFDRDSVQRRIQRAERAGLVEKSGRSPDLLQDFYKLFLMTRRRQRVPPAPFRWFQNLVQELGTALTIYASYYEDRPIAAILTLRFKQTCYYKYGCSDARFNQYGATPWLFWKAMTAAKSEGATQFDLGRTEISNPGLLAFKNQWVPHPRKIVYWRYPSSSSRSSSAPWHGKLARSVFSLLPGKVQAGVGKVLYPHIG